MNLKALNATIAAQFGILTRKQAAAAGLTDRAIEGRINRNEWVRIYDGLYQLAGLNISWRCRLLAVQLSAGQEAVISYEAAAALLGLEGFNAALPEITIPNSRRTIQGATVHFTNWLPPDQIIEIEPFVLTSVPRTLLDLCAVVSEEQAEVALCDTLRRRLTSIPKLERFLIRAARRGRRGAAVLAKLVRVVDPSGLDSKFEVLFARLLRKARLFPEAHYKVVHGGEVIAEVDFAFVEQRLAIECDGHGSHVLPEDFRRNIKRYNALDEAAWGVRRFEYIDLKRPQFIFDTIRRALKQGPDEALFASSDA